MGDISMRWGEGDPILVVVVREGLRKELHIMQRAEEKGILTSGIAWATGQI